MARDAVLHQFVANCHRTAPPHRNSKFPNVREPFEGQVEKRSRNFFSPKLTDEALEDVVRCEFGGVDDRVSADVRSEALQHRVARSDSPLLPVVSDRGTFAPQRERIRTVQRPRRPSVR